MRGAPCRDSELAVRHVSGADAPLQRARAASRAAPAHRKGCAQYAERAVDCAAQHSPARSPAPASRFGGACGRAARQAGAAPSAAPAAAGSVGRHRPSHTRAGYRFPPALCVAVRAAPSSARGGHRHRAAGAGAGPRARVRSLTAVSPARGAHEGWRHFPVRRCTSRSTMLARCDVHECAGAPRGVPRLDPVRGARYEIDGGGVKWGRPA